MTLTHLSLFSGIGGIDLAAEWAGFKTVCFVEIDKYCRGVLRKHWPNIPIIEDVKDVTKEKIAEYTFGQPRPSETETRLELERNLLSEARRNQDTDGARAPSEPRIDLISGGFPCQPHSVAGKRKGSSDERNLWPEFRRVIGEIRPKWVLAENVSGLFSSDSGRFFGNILTDLAALGYSTGWCTYGAVDVGALHRRDRVFIVAHASECIGLASSTQSDKRDSQRCGQEMADTIEQGLQVRQESNVLGQCEAIERDCIATAYPSNTPATRQRGNRRQISTIAEPTRPDLRCGLKWWAIEPNVGRVAYGVSHRVDRLKALGNAVVPQQIYPVLKTIAEIEHTRNSTGS